MRALIGPANSGKTERIISRVAEAMTEARGQVCVIVPSAHASSAVLDRLVDRLAARELKSKRQALTTFPNLYSAIIGRLGRNYTLLNLIERDRLLRRVIYELEEAGRLVYFAGTSGMPGLVSAVAGFIDELWQTGLSPDAFNRIAGARGKKDKDLAMIYESYAETLNVLNATDSEAAGYLASRALASTPPSQSLGFSLVAADGFDFYSPVQTRVLALLAARGVETIVSLTYEEGRAAHLWQKPTVERLRNAGVEFVQCSASPSTMIEVAAARFMSDDATRGSNEPEQGDAIQIISAPDRAAEARAAAHEVKRLAIENDYALRDIAIVCRSLSLYAHHIERVFGECSIPLTLDCSLGVAENPAILSLLKLLRLGSKSFPRRATIECLRSPYFDFSGLGLNETAADLLDTISLETNVTRGRDQWITAIGTYATRMHRRRGEYGFNEDDGVTIEQREAQFVTLQSNLNKFFEILTAPAAAPGSALAEWVIGTAEKFRAQEPAGATETGPRDKKALAEFYSIVNALGGDRVGSRLSGEHSREVRWPHFLAELERALSAVTYDRESPASDCVSVQEAHKTWPRRYRALFVLGLVEGEFPAKTAERAPFTNREREELRGAGVDLTETATDAGGDLTQFCKAIARATERLYLSYSRTDLTGGELLPSYLIEEVSAVARVKETRIPQGFANAEQLISRNAASLEELAVMTARALASTANEGGFRIHALAEDARAASRLLDSQLPSWKTTLRGAAVERRRLYGSERGCYDGIIRDGELIDRLGQKFGPRHLWSASQINDYGSCPFRFFARHALKLTSAVEPGEGFAADQLGNAYHKILERLYARLRYERIRVSPETSEMAVAFADEASDEVLQEMLDGGTVRKGLLWDLDKREIKRRVARLLIKEAEWNDEQSAQPIHLERKFGIGGEPPLVIEGEGGEVRLCGQIDRIDERDDGWVVIDYKTGRTPIPRSDALDGRNLQLPIYVMAATRAVDTTATVASAYYLHIGSRKKGSELSRGDDSGLSVEALIEHAEKRILDYVARARKGIFPVKPNDDRCHPGCEFDAMCRIQSLGSSASGE
ncbi:MAG TPA: PD-(D/E)XK nuclease family protein [Blastocatellia bacterium]|nr:PD-(D/E)XK nuclease family protein [Blastocatellia bacterium]